MEHNKTIGLILPPESFLFSSHESNYYFTEILRGVLAVSNLFKYYITIDYRALTLNEEYFSSFIDEENLKGLLLLAPVLKEQDIKDLKKIKLPFLLVNARYEGYNYIDTDNVNGAEIGVEYLIEKGHKKIVIINGLMETTNAQDRFEGYKKSLKKNSIKLDEKLIGYGNFFEDSGYMEMEKILDNNRDNIPTAVFCANDLMAFGAMKLFKKKKLKVPEDISIIGFNDNVVSSYLTPPLTSVRQQLFHIGKEGMSALIGIINKERQQPLRLELKTRLIVRKTVAFPKKK